MQANPFRWFKPVISPNPDKEGLSKPQQTHKPLLWERWALFVSLECGGKSCDAVWSFCDFKGISAMQGAELEDHGIRLDTSEKLFTPHLLRINFPMKAVYWSNSLQLLSNALFEAYSLYLNSEECVLQVLFVLGQQLNLSVHRDCGSELDRVEWIPLRCACERRALSALMEWRLIDLDRKSH